MLASSTSGNPSREISPSIVSLWLAWQPAEAHVCSPGAPERSFGGLLEFASQTNAHINKIEMEFFLFLKVFDKNI